MKKLFRGSALVYALIMMMLLLVSALSLATTTVLQKRSATSTVESMRAFESANDGFEDVLSRYKRNPNGTVGSLGTSCDSSTGAVTQTVGTSLYTATFKDASGTDITSCATKLSDVAQVKVVATVGSSTKAIETALAAGTQMIHVYHDNAPSDLDTAKDASTDAGFQVEEVDFLNGSNGVKTGQEICEEAVSGSVCVGGWDLVPSNGHNVPACTAFEGMDSSWQASPPASLVWTENLISEDVIYCIK